MEYVMFLALSAIVSVIFGWVQPRVFANSHTTKYQGTYAGRTALTTGVIFLTLMAAAFLMSMVAGKSAASIPTA